MQECVCYTCIYTPASCECRLIAVVVGFYCDVISNGEACSVAVDLVKYSMRLVK